VYSHPQGLRQCSQFIASHHLEEVVCTSTAEACRQVAAEGNGVALGATGMEVEFDLIVARSSVGNLAGALTRFLVIGTEDAFGEPRPEDHTTRSLWVTTPDALGPAFTDPYPRYDEVLRGPSGHSLVVSTQTDRLEEGPNVRFIGTIPWSPRTPLVTL
jgi:hypothetical protein